MANYRIGRKRRGVTWSNNVTEGGAGWFLKTIWNSPWTGSFVPRESAARVSAHTMNVRNISRIHRLLVTGYNSACWGCKVFCEEPEAREIFIQVASKVPLLHGSAIAWHSGLVSGLRRAGPGCSS